MYINGKIVSTITDIPSTDCLIRSAFESKQIMDSSDSTNPIIPMSLEDTIIPSTYQSYGFSSRTAGVTDALQDFTQPCPYTGHNLYAWNNMGAYKYCKENIVTFNIPLPLFMFPGFNREGIPPGNKVKISLYASPY